MAHRQRRPHLCKYARTLLKLSIKIRVRAVTHFTAHWWMDRRHFFLRFQAT